MAKKDKMFLRCHHPIRSTTNPALTKLCGQELFIEFDSERDGSPVQDSVRLAPESRNNGIVSSSKKSVRCDRCNHSNLFPSWFRDYDGRLSP